MANFSRRKWFKRELGNPDTKDEEEGRKARTVVKKYRCIYQKFEKLTIHPFENLLNIPLCQFKLNLNHVTIHINQTITLYALHLYSDVCQLFLSKTGKKS